ncbi:PWWP domain-containing protein 2A-like [Cylas formicarius]|uniref:PWWP domain-containing protein 2A-like n=1 Tax=Cylas formicarius TaxID=197179 RepID=UPI0029589455|nr:PWWP domain-containing protein 2A-like [Cylas formicarius]
MADEIKDIKLLKNTKISVYVDEALPDIIVVTYEFGLKLFKGVLLDSNKRNLPCGIQSLNPAFTVPSKKPDDDPLYSVNQRFSYMDPNAPKKKNIQMPSKYKNNKMTVRLRPRQVLCSKCKGICNENSENVSRKRKSSDGAKISSPPPPSRRGSNAPVTRSVNTYLNTTRRKLRRQEMEEGPKVTKSDSIENINPENWDAAETSEKPLDAVNLEGAPRTVQNPKHSPNHSESSSDHFEPPRLTQTQSLRAARRTVRKKRNVGPNGSQWTDDEKTGSMNSEQAVNSSGITTNTRTIKISYGPQGEGTVLKIPAQIDNVNGDDSEENVNVGRPPLNLPNKAARKAMKRARKEARRKILLGGSPLYLGGTSPRYALGNGSPRYTVGSASPRHGLGNNSPRYMIPAFDINVSRRRKHKVKHKKKHKDDKDRKHKEGEVSSSTQDETKEQCITQKLSINLKRLNEMYTSCTVHEDTTSSSDEHSEQMPDFPPANQPLMLRINARTLSSAMGADGVRLLVGDVVWGKIHGFPWWPGKILTISGCNAQGPQAHVAWYGSSTSSVMQCDQLSHYLDNFKARYNKKKKGLYKEAIKQATSEAKENAENRVRQPLGNSPSHNIIPQVVPPALASPREIDVAS